MHSLSNHAGNFEAFVWISDDSIKSDIRWWIDNIEEVVKLLVGRKPKLTLTADVSTLG